MKANGLLAGLILALALAACQNAEKGPDQKTVENVSFEATMEAEDKKIQVLSRDSEGNPIQVLFTAEGSGEMTHLGKVKVFREGGRNETNGLEVIKLIYIDSNNDTLIMGSRTSVAADGSLSGQQEVIGGTGRYANASGMATSTGSMQDGVTSWTQTGTITY